MNTRRDFGKLALAALPAAFAPAEAAPAVSSEIHGVRVGVATYSYNTLPRQGLLDVVIASMRECGIRGCLLNPPPTEPPDLSEKVRTVAGGRAPANPEQAAAAEQLHRWHLTVSLSYYTALRKKFSDAGLEIEIYQPSLLAPISDEDLNRACEVTRTLGTRCMAGAFTKSVARRLAPIAEKHGLTIALQGRPNLKSTDPDVMSKPADFAEAMGYSKHYRSSIDTGDATAGGWDALKFVEENHATVYSLNLKDRTKAGQSVPWGQGDARVKEILQLIRDRNYPIRGYIDCDYATAPGGSRTADIKRCADFARSALA